MLSSLRHRALALLLPLTFAAAGSTACSSHVAADADSSAEPVNYRSTSGQEYSLSTNVTFQLPSEISGMEGDAKDAALLKYAETLRGTITSAVEAELDRVWPEDERTSNKGVAIEFRQASATLNDLRLVDDGDRYGMTVSAEFAGVKDLAAKLPMKTVEGVTFFPVSADLGNGNGAEELQLTLTPVTRSLNAYPQYLALFEDGLDIAVHVGGDHDIPAQDIDHARSVYDDLIASGFTSPVAKFDDLKLDSGPLTSTIKVAGNDVAVRVRIVDVDMSTPDTRQVLIDAYKGSVKTADVIIYDGHAGRQVDYSGVVVAYVPARVALPASEFKNIETTDKQQVYLFNGCETYTGYADSMYLNPKRNTANTDIITTGNFSAIQAKANQVISFIHSFIDQSGGTWIPRSWDGVLSRMNAVGEESWVHVYGVHGLDDNPKISPLADVSKVGAECTADADCGAADSRCLQVSATKSVCGVACADTTGCPTGTQCVLPKGRTSVDDLQCSAQ